MKKLLAATAVGFLTLGLAACSSGDSSEKGRADLSKPVESVDEAWEQLDELNYSFSKVADAEWVETIAPMLVQCASDPEKVQVFTGKKGVFSVEKHDTSKVAADIAKILENSGLETSVEEDTMSDETSESEMSIVNVYAFNEENMNASLMIDETGYIDLTSYSKCVPGAVNDAWTAPGRVPIIKQDNTDEIEVVDEGESTDEAPLEEEVVIEEEVIEE